MVPESKHYGDGIFVFQFLSDLYAPSKAAKRAERNFETLYLDLITMRPAVHQPFAKLQSV